MKETRTPRKIAEQLLAAGTAIGSNLEEAEAGHSHADFVAKISICLKEARESRFWLRLLVTTGLAPSERLDPWLKESTELIRIFTAIRKNAGHRAG